MPNFRLRLSVVGNSLFSQTGGMLQFILGTAGKRCRVRSCELNELDMTVMGHVQPQNPVPNSNGVSGTGGRIPRA